MLTIRKRGKNFHVRGSIRVGRETRIVKEHSCGTDRRDAADEYRSKLETDVRHEILHGSGGRTHTLTIADAGLRYMARPGGIRSYDVWRIGQLNKVVGDRPIAKSADAWSEFKRIRCGGLSPATVQRFRATFQAAVNYLAQEDGFDAPKLSRGERAGNKRFPYLSTGQADRLVLAYAKHVQPIAITLRWQGLRIGEALRIDWAHVNWSGDSIFIVGGKTGEPRTVTMQPPTRAALHRLLASRGSPKEGPVFLTQLGLPYADPRQFKFPSGSGIKKAHATACRRAGIADFRVHDWRHHWACQCVMSGIDLETIKQEGGWKSLRMVERYATVSAAHRKRPWPAYIPTSRELQ
jgi:integrase